MSERRAAGSGIDIVEWRAHGHRMTYVASIVRAANEVGLDVVLWTAPEVLETEEFQTQLSDLVSTGRLSICLVPDLGTTGGLIRHLGAIRRQGRAAVVPEADRFLHALGLALVARRLPRPTSVIIMRPPQSVTGRFRGRIGSIAKTALIVVLSPWRALDIQLLEDPLAQANDRVWTTPFLSRASFRLDDPCGLLETSAAEFPEELLQRPSSRPFLAVVGVIDGRKNLPLILEAWRLRPNSGSDLIVAGKQTSAVSTWLESTAPPTPDSTFVNRYLTEAEIRGVLERSSGILALYDGGFSSGLVIAAAAIGRWTIALEGSRTGTVARRHGFGVVCAPHALDLADAMEQVLTQTATPVPVLVPGSRDFGRHVLRRVIEAQDRG